MSQRVCKVVMFGTVTPNQGASIETGALRRELIAREVITVVA
jgi:hypothetical protein